LKVAIVHYHLRRGGVTRVIENTIASLQPHEDVEICVLSGEAYEGDPRAIPNRAVVDGLGYRNSASDEDARQLATDLFKAAKEQLGGPPDVWHFHNHSLAKNVCMPQAIHELILDGARVLLQIHDFAEDGRPANYARQRSHYANLQDYRRQLYPRGSQVHYATLNARDASHLRSAGVYEPLLHLLPNSVEAPPSETPRTDPFPVARQVCLYPTRGIRRKNMGELLFLSSLFGEEVAFVSTLGPDNPEWQKIHDDWVRFAKDLGLQTHLAFGQTGAFSYPELIARADSFITTSVAEGFGLAFLEPWLTGKSVAGRNLPAITSDFTNVGVTLPGMYDRLDVPLKWIDADGLRASLEGGLHQSYLSYGEELPSDAVDRAWNACVQEDLVDFGRLDEGLQREAILKCSPDGVAMPDLEPADSEVIAANQAAVEEHFGREGYGNRLHEVYHNVAKSPLDDVTFHDPSSILNSFLRPEDFMLLRSDP